MYSFPELETMGLSMIPWPLRTSSNQVTIESTNTVLVSCQ